MKFLLNTFILSSLIWGFSGCMVGPKYQRPETNQASTFSRDAGAISMKDSVTSLQWSALFTDPVLQSLIDSGIRHNYDLKKATARIEQAGANYGIAVSQLFPSLFYQVHGSHSINNSVTRSNYFIGPGMSWEIDIWGKIRHARNAALDDLLASEAGRRAVHCALVASVADGYYRLRDFDKRLAVSRATYESRNAGYILLEERYKKGYISEWDLLQGKQLLDDAEASISIYTRAVTVTQNYLCYLIAMPPGELPRGLSNTDQPVMPIIPAGLPSTLLSKRPDLKQAEYVYMRETERIGVALAQRLPTLSLTVAGGLSNPELSGLLGSGALGVSITEGLLGPLFEFGRNKRRVTAQMKSAEIAAFDYKQIYLKSLVEVENALVSIETLNKELNARQRMLTAARQALDLSRARYESGYTSYLELMDAERSLFEMEVLVSSVRQQQLSAYVELYRALGGG